MEMFPHGVSNTTAHIPAALSPIRPGRPPAQPTCYAEAATPARARTAVRFNSKAVPQPCATSARVFALFSLPQIFADRNWPWMVIRFADGGEEGRRFACLYTMFER